MQCKDTQGVSHHGAHGRVRGLSSTSCIPSLPPNFELTVQIYLMLEKYDWDDLPGAEDLYDDIIDIFDGPDADEEWAGDTLVYLQGCVVYF